MRFFGKNKAKELFLNTTEQDFKSVETFLFQQEFTEKPYYKYITIKNITDYGWEYRYYKVTKDFGHWHIVTTADF